jgi:flagellar biosynthesis protein FlhF
MVEITASADVNTAHPRQRRAILAGDPVPEIESKPQARAVSSGAGATSVAANSTSAFARAYQASAGGSSARAASPSKPAGEPSVSTRATTTATPSRVEPRSSAGDPAPVFLAAPRSDRAPRPSTNAPTVAQIAIESAGVQTLERPSAADHGLHAELAAIKRMVGQVLQSSGSTAAPACAMPAALLKHYMKLIEQEVSRELADELVAAVRDELTPAELSDEGIVRQSVLRRLESLLPTADCVAKPARAGERPLTIALIGPTGVGKTTTIAKLAAAYKLRHAKRVALITSDTYRIAAVDQLRTYANIIGVPLKVVNSPEEMASAIAALREFDVVLIDTAGRSPGDRERLGELASFIDAAAPHQTHLVLAGVASEPAMVRIIERFGPLKPNHVIFTKLDEAAQFGVLVNVARRIDAKLSFVTTGQEVPDDIEPTRADRLARLVLDGAQRP